MLSGSKLGNGDVLLVYVCVCVFRGGWVFNGKEVCESVDNRLLFCVCWGCCVSVYFVCVCMFFLVIDVWFLYIHIYIFFRGCGRVKWLIFLRYFFSGFMMLKNCV